MQKSDIQKVHSHCHCPQKMPQKQRLTDGAEADGIPQAYWPCKFTGKTTHLTRSASPLINACVFHQKAAPCGCKMADGSPKSARLYHFARSCAASGGGTVSREQIFAKSRANAEDEDWQFGRSFLYVKSSKGFFLY